MKKLSLLFVTLLFVLSVSADDSTMSMSQTDTKSSTGEVVTPTVDTIPPKQEMLPPPMKMDGHKKEELKGQIKEAKEQLKDDTKKKVEELKNKIKEENSEVRSDIKDLKSKISLTEEQKTKLDYLKKSLESEIKTLRESITKDNLADIKVKAEALKTTYLAKIEEIAPGITELKKMIEDRFVIFSQNQYERREGASQIRKEVKENFKQIKQDLVAKYKEAFTKQLSSKLDTMSIEKLKIVLERVNKNIETQKTKTSPNEKVLAQLSALQNLIQEKIDENDTSSDINIDELLK